MRQNHKTIILWGVLFLMFYLIWNIMQQNQVEPTEMPFSQFLTEVENGSLTNIAVEVKNETEFSWTKDGKKSRATGKLTDSVIDKMQKQKVGFKLVSEEGGALWQSLLLSWLPMVLVFLFRFFLMRQLQSGGGKAMSFGKSKARLISEGGPKVTFKDVAGVEEAKEELREIIEFLKDPKKFTRLGGRIPKGVLLMGPPGTGKTLLARGVAGEAGVPFFSISGSDFVEMFVGVGASRVRDLFEQSKKQAPCIIFIDEIDAVGRHRGAGLGGGHDEREQTLNQLLVAMDGFEASEGVFVIGASNRADLLDPALVRPGRIDKRIFISLPDSKTRDAILQIHIKGKPHESNINIPDLVDLTNGMSAAQIENVLNEAMLHAIRYNRTKFSHDDIDVVMNRILAGWQPTEHQFSHEMIEQIVIHEMGHAMIGFLARQHAKLTKIVINLSSPNSPGYTVFEGSTSALYTRESLFEHLMILLAGRVAEEVFYNVSVTTGAINDFEEALKLAEKMVVYYGMGNSLIYPSNSEKYKEQIDNEVVQLIQDAYNLSRFIVSNCKDVITYCAEILKTERILRREELVRIIEEKYPSILNLYVGTSATLYE